jgi:uncharacterized protein YxeA
MEKYLIFLIIIILIIVIYCLFCNQTDTKDTFTSLVGCNTDVTLLATLARNLQSTSEDAIINTHLNLKNKHILSSDSDGWLRLKSYSNLTQNADMAVGNLNVIGNFNLLPRGIIVAWNNSVVPVGWALCNGTFPTPDLRGRFILGKPENTFNAANLNADLKTGGYENITLNINQIPSHNHKYWKPQNGAYVGDMDDRRKVYYSTGNVNNWSSGEGKAFNNMPPYYVLVYIMKL